MIYNVTNAFTQLTETTGTIQNSGSNSIEVSDRRAPGTGIILKPGEKFSFTDKTLYVRGEGRNSTVRVVPFVLGAGGVVSVSGGTDTQGDSTNYTGDVDDMWNESGDPTEEMWNTPTAGSFDEEFDSVLDDIYGFDNP